MIELHLAAVQVEMATKTPILLLSEMGGGGRTLPVYIGASEAQAIAQALQGVETPRPMTHDLMRDLLVDLGASLDSVVITELRDRTFFAELRMPLGDQSHSVSARPSDAVALAVRTSSPIYAEDALMDAESVIIEGNRDEEVEGVNYDDEVSRFAEFIDGIRPEDFGT